LEEVIGKEHFWHRLTKIGNDLKGTPTTKNNDWTMYNKITTHKLGDTEKLNVEIKELNVSTKITLLTKFFAYFTDPNIFLDIDIFV